MVTGLSDASFDLYASVSTDAVVDVWGWLPADPDSSAGWCAEP